MERIVQIERNGERFWLKHVYCIEGGFTGSVDNDLICNDGIKFGDSLRFSEDEILKTWVD